MFYRMMAVLFVLLFFLTVSESAELDYVWIEGENPTDVPQLSSLAEKQKDKGYEMKGWGNANLMSAGKVLNIHIDKKTAHKRLPVEGAIFGYEFDIESPGRHEIWARIGYEWVRSDFDWRIDNKPWKTLKSDQKTYDLQPIGFWCEIAWIKLGNQELSHGKHKLQIRHTKQTQIKNGKEEAARTLHFSDCFCISKDIFIPNGKHKPNTDYMTEIDKTAAKHVYNMAHNNGSSERISLELTGLWQIARWDEQEVSEQARLKGVDSLPSNIDALFWRSITLPSNRNKVRPDLSLCHRYIYRTKINVPANLKGRSFYLDFENFNMIATVFVNGVNCGWSKTFSTQWKCDITKAVKPGYTNDFAVVLKDAYYAIHAPDQQYGTRYYWNLPPDMLHNQGITMRMDMPIVWDHCTGILEPVSLVAAGGAYTDDIFVKTSVKKKTIELELCLKNPSRIPQNVTIANKVIPWNKGKGGKAEKVFTEKIVALPAAGEATLEISEPWQNPELWWPDNPQLYWLVTRLSVDGKPIDTKKTRFGFREWEWSSDLFKLNGVNWQMWTDGYYGSSPEEWLARTKESGMNMIRFWFKEGWGGKSRKELLNYFDEQGIPVRDSGVFDGEHAAYGLTEGEGNNKKAKKALFDNWIHQMKAWVKANRNHPSIFIWSIENEITYINSQNLGVYKWVEPEIRRGSEVVEKMDPTRPTMVDGGRCLRDNSMPVNGAHYNDLSGVARRDFPDAAYTREHWYQNKNRGAWEMVRNRPIFHGECFYANGWTPAEFSVFGGDRCFVGQSETAYARGLYAKMLTEGWRWAGVAAWHMWFEMADHCYWNACQPVCVFCREWNWTFAGKSTVNRTLAVFNSTRFDTPIEMKWKLRINKNTVASGKKICNVPPGEKQIVRVSFETPQVKIRAEGEFVMTCEQDGKEVFREVKEVSIINQNEASVPKLSEKELAVLDTDGAVKARLRKRGIRFTEIASLDALPPKVKVIVVGRNAVSKELATDGIWYSLAAQGKRLLVLDQNHPLHYQAVPADFEVMDYTGRIAFSEDMTHPVFDGLAQKDFFTWSKDHIVYRNVYRKATKGARSLVQCDEELGFSAISECAVGDGLMLLCQMVVGTKLRSDPVATRLFDNMLNYAIDYEAVKKNTAVVMDSTTSMAKLLNSTGLKYDVMTDPLKVLGGAKYGVAVIDATPDNLATLAADLNAVKTYTENGGWIMLTGLTPDGLEAYNKIVGFNHAIRPFQMERVVFSAPRDPLTAGLTLRDVVMDSGKPIFHFMSLKFPAEDEFSYIIDYDEIATFAKLPSPSELGKPDGASQKGWDHWPQNLVNNYTADDTWRFCYSILLDRGDKTKWTMELPKEETISNFSIVLNVIYHKVTKINLYFDNDPTPFTINTQPTHDRQDFAVKGKKAKIITIELADWEKSGDKNVIGIDNMWIGVKRPASFLRNVKSLLNIGGLMRYNMGKGGILLNQLNILENEQNPINADKKKGITKTLLMNLGSVFEGAKVVAVGEGLEYHPIEIPARKFNAYTTDKGNPGWFGTHGATLDFLPVGEQNFNGVKYKLLDFRTSPVPSCFMLSGHQSASKATEIRQISVGRTADAIFFLHTFNPSRHAKNWKRKTRKGELQDYPTAFEYTVHYSTGKVISVPVKWKHGIGSWYQTIPEPFKNAAVAWSTDIPDNGQGQKAVLFSMQWNNPNPELKIESVDMVQGKDGSKWGSPALLAITAADVIE